MFPSLIKFEILIVACRRVLYKARHKPANFNQFHILLEFETKRQCINRQSQVEDQMQYEFNEAICRRRPNLVSLCQIC